jgi:hypothetical protein
MCEDATYKRRLHRNRLPAVGDEDREAPDDRRSEQRIPESAKLVFRSTSFRPPLTRAVYGRITNIALTANRTARSETAGLPMCFSASVLQCFRFRVKTLVSCTKEAAISRSHPLPHRDPIHTQEALECQT